MYEYAEPALAIWPALITAGAGIFGGRQSAKGLKRQNLFARQEAQRNRDFQERMSSTSHQREVEDLRAAGLNPILSATGGSGASTPGGSMAAQVDELTGAVSSAREVARAAAEIANIYKTGKLIDANAAKARSEKTLTDTTERGRQSELAEKRVSETIWDSLSQMFQTSAQGKPNLWDFIKNTASSTSRDIKQYRLPTQKKKKPFTVHIKEYSDQQKRRLNKK